MENQPTIAERVTDLLADQLGVNEEQVKPESKLAEDLGADSLDDVETIMALEEEFGFEIQEEEFATLKTVGDVIQFIETKTT